MIVAFACIKLRLCANILRSGLVPILLEMSNHNRTTSKCVSHRKPLLNLNQKLVKLSQMSDSSDVPSGILEKKECSGNFILLPWCLLLAHFISLVSRNGPEVIKRAKKI